MTVRMALSVGCILLAGLGGATLYARHLAAPACDSDHAQGQVYRVLRDKFQLSGVFLHDFTAVSGGFFDTSRDCVAEVAEIRGNVYAADMRWRHIHYHILRSNDPERPVVTVELGDDTAFVQPPERTMWTRLLAHF